jgi:hypothetical protein
MLKLEDPWNRIKVDFDLRYCSLHIQNKRLQGTIGGVSVFVGGELEAVLSSLDPKGDVREALSSLGTWLMFSSINFYILIIPPANVVWGYIGIGLSVRTNFQIFCPISTKLCGI